MAPHATGPAETSMEIDVNRITDFLLLAPFIIVAWTMCALVVVSVVRIIHDIYKRGW